MTQQEASSAMSRVLVSFFRPGFCSRNTGAERKKFGEKPLTDVVVQYVKMISSACWNRNVKLGDCGNGYSGMD